MKKKRILTGLLLVSVAAFAFTACGKKKSKTTGAKTTQAKITTKASTTTKKQDEIKLTNYFTKDINNGLIGFEVRKKNDELQYVNIVMAAMEGMPITLQPIIENGNITKVKVGTFMSSSYLIQTLFEILAFVAQFQSHFSL